MRVTSAESTELFVGTTEHPHQVMAVELSHAPGRTVRIVVTGPGVSGTTLATTGDDGTVRAEIPVTTDLAPGDGTHVTVTAEDAVDPQQTGALTVPFRAAEPGWTAACSARWRFPPPTPGKRSACCAVPRSAA